MESTQLAQVKTPPLAELPAAALRTAMAFVDRENGHLANVGILPVEGVEDRVTLRAASMTRAVEIEAEGSAQRPLLIPGRCLLPLAARHNHGQHVAIGGGGDQFLQVRSYASDSTLAISVPECYGQPLPMPHVDVGPFTDEGLQFSLPLLAATLHTLKGAATVKVQPFRLGLLIEASFNAWEARVILAGCV